MTTQNAKITLEDSLDIAFRGMALDLGYKTPDDYADALHDESEPYFNEEYEYEKAMDYKYFLAHGGDPWWAQ